MRPVTPIVSILEINEHDVVPPAKSSDDRLTIFTQRPILCVVDGARIERTQVQRIRAYRTDSARLR